MNKLIMMMVAAAVLSFSTVASADESTDKMEWSLKNRTKMKCSLKDAMQLSHGGDFVETKRLVCWDGTDLAVSATVACGPEGSVTRFDGHKIKVTCQTPRFARK